MVNAIGKYAAGDVHLHLCRLEGVDAKTTGDGVRVFIDHLRERFVKADTDRVDLLYMSFKSVSRQRLTYEQLLLVVGETFTANGVVADSFKPYLFEPDATTIFSTVLPMFLLLGDAGKCLPKTGRREQAARVMAMQSANDNAKKLLEQRSEQQRASIGAITSEPLDIPGGQVR